MIFSTLIQIAGLVIGSVQANTNIAASIGKLEISLTDIQSTAPLSFYLLEEEKYELTQKQVYEIATARFISEAAKSRGLREEDFIKNEILSNKVRVSEKELTDFIRSRRIPEIEVQKDPSIRQKVMVFLENQKRNELMDAFRIEKSKFAPIQLNFSRPKPLSIEAGPRPSFGNKTAKVQIVEFFDFECPFSAASSKALNEIKNKYGNRIRVTLRNFPLPRHSKAFDAAQASLCIYAQGNEKYWKFQTEVLQSPDKLEPKALETLALKIGVDPQKYQECLSSGQFRNLVQEDIQYGEKIGIQSTPTFFINGRPYIGEQSVKSLAQAIEEAL